MRKLPILLALLLLPITNALVVVINTYDWQAAYLVGFYATKAGVQVIGLPSEEYALKYVPNLIPSNEEVVVYEGPHPVVPNYAAVLRSRGIQNVRTRGIGNVYDLMFELPKEFNVETNGVMLVPDSSAFWALAAGPLAFKENLQVIFVNSRTIDRILSTVTNVKYVVGYPGKRIKEAYPSAKFIATGDRYKDEVLLAKELNKLVKYTTVNVVSGFVMYLPMKLESSVWWTGMGGTRAVVVAPPTLPWPEELVDFLKNPQIKHIEASYEFLSIKDDLKKEFQIYGKDVKVLYLVTYVGMENGKLVAVQMPPQGIVLPDAQIRLSVEAISALPSGQLFLTIRNIGDSLGYFKITYLEINCPGFERELKPDVLGFVDGRDATVVEINIGEAIPVAQCSAVIKGIYGPDTDRMFGELSSELKFSPKEIKDRSKVHVEKVLYSPRLERIVVYLKNDSPVGAYAFVIVKGLLVDGIPSDYISNQVYVPPNGSAKAYVRVFLTDADVLDNSEVRLILRYGENKTIPVHVSEQRLPLEKETLTDVVIEFVTENSLLVAAVVVIIILLLLFLRKR